MKTRILTAIAIAAVVIPTLIFSGTLLYPIVMSALSVMAVFEMLRVLGYAKKPAVVLPAYLIALAFPTAAYFASADIIKYAVIGASVLFIYLLYLLTLSVLTKGELKITGMSAAFCTTVYVILAFSALSAVRTLDNGAFYMLIPFICSWVSDTFAYFVGRLLGKHKLIPEISPKKTVEGSIGGVVFAVLAMLLFGFIVDSFFGDITVNYLVLGLMGFVLSIISQIGDLIASSLKREYGVKDYSNLLPGHGGIADRFDSIFAIALLVLAICAAFPPFITA